MGKKRKDANLPREKGNLPKETELTREDSGEIDLCDVTVTPNTIKKKKRICGCCCFCYVFLSFLILLLFTPVMKQRFDPDDLILDEVITQLGGAIPLEGLHPVDRPGLRMSKEGYEAHYPVVLIPGIISSGLEVWKGKPCAQRHFRERFWGTSLMIQKILLSRKCWKEHICLNHTTFMDPEGIKIRSANGLGAADYFLGDFWVWGKVIENLADVGYDESNMIMASYDWRLPFEYLETRDNYFTRLKSHIELLKSTNGGKKVAIIGHSMGSLIMVYFNKWVESDKGGKGGPNWIKDHVASETNIGGPLLGVMKSLSCVLSGEMRDTAELNLVLSFIKENLLSKNDMLEIFRSFGSIPSMFPKGGNRIWGGEDQESPDGNNTYVFKFTTPEEQWSLRTIISPLDGTTVQGMSDCPNENTPLDKMLNDTLKKKISEHNYPLEEALDLLREVMPIYMEKIDSLYSFGLSRNLSDPSYDHPRYWANPLESSLPNAPDMTFYCLYGVGKETERFYYYTESDEKCTNIPFVIDTKVNNGSDLNYGIQAGEGDGTVPLMSLGYMCAKGWKDKVYNPHKVKVITREFRHETESVLQARDNVLRGGTATADHIDIMGNHYMLQDIIKITTNKADQLHDRYFSKIQEYAEKVHLNKTPNKKSTPVTRKNGKVVDEGESNGRSTPNIVESAAKKVAEVKNTIKNAAKVAKEKASHKLKTEL
eukprot:TRINITY_DN4943_c0_g1_i1.p1 TRINITY_DN4943_c0_g1~~TRINITY_DN4943_c0_g1_i1.p1  ORF type:complete len:723 (-),score=239.02 TRINITY_DN4943_c0_g1_i1:50-2176(-)